jgi:peptidylprolyl isomerase
MKLNWWQIFVKITLISILTVTTTIAFNPWGMPKAEAVLAQGDAITDPNAILRYALPIENQDIRTVQSNIEKIGRNLRSKRWKAVEKNVRDAQFALKLHSDDIISGTPEKLQPRATELISLLKDEVINLEELVTGQKREDVYITRAKILGYVTEIEENMVQGFPFEVPAEYSSLPQLLGRAKVDIETSKGNLIMVVDGYSAPVTGGNFVDLVKRKFYDGLPFIRAEDFYVLQTGDPEGKEEGFIDPKTKQYRGIPLEILVKGESEPIYGFTTEDVGMYLAQPVLPFNAYGAVALARPSTDPNGGSSQFFFFKFDTEVTPPGYNLMDGRFAVFGYVTEGADVLDKLTAEDKIISAKVIEGAENFIPGT